VSRSQYFPVFLDLRGRRCVVLGSGQVADEKAASLQDAGAVVVRHERAFRSGDLAGAFLAVDASGDTPGQTAARREADREHVLLNVVDVADRCDWIAPAVVRRGPVQVAISTSGESPFLAATLRARIEGLVGAEWGRFAEVVGRVRRRLRRRGIAADSQRRVYERLLRSDVLALLREGDAEAAESLAAAIESSAYRGDPADAVGEVILAGAGPGDPALLTVAARDALAYADVIFHDALVDPAVLGLSRTGARMVDVGKRAGRASTPQAEINAAMADAAARGEVVVRLKGGDPFLFGRGGEEVNAMHAAGVPVRVIPGVSAALSAPAAAGIPVTHRGVAGSVGIVTGQRAADADDKHLERIAAAADTLVVLMPVELEGLTHRLTSVVGAHRPAALVSRATTGQQRVVRGTVSSVASIARSAGLEAPATLIIGDVVNAITPAAAMREPAASS
jgi:uroporphyrin-III C-methyltransferase / precorrin-2 dehydrogenase / sirohydrochlorin ferrochelatase